MRKRTLRERSASRIESEVIKKSAMLDVCLTVDMEPDCPPYLNTFRGVEEGTDILLDVMSRKGIKTTFFVTGSVALRYPETLREILSQGHEVGSHGFSHQPFTDMDRNEAKDEICASMEALAPFCRVVSFRAPNLKFPKRYLGLLEEAGFLIDSSEAKYKVSCYLPTPPTLLLRVPVSVTSSVLRLPLWMRLPWLRSLASPVVLFVHPWEFVDLRNEKLRIDCRFRTGLKALGSLENVLDFFKRRGARFLRMQDLYSS